MKKSIKHLPQTKQDELHQITSVIQQNCKDVEMIILFGSYARGKWKEESDLDPNRKSGHKSDYDILVITQNQKTAYDTKLWNEITNICSRLKQSTHTRIIAHDIEFTNIQLAGGQYFFSDIKKEGCLLYDSNNFHLAKKRELTPQERKRIAQDHYEHWFKKATEFLGYFQDGIVKQQYASASFQLHQATEAAYKTILLVFTNYSPHEHYLGLLERMASAEDTRFRGIFPETTKKEQDRFRLLDYAYIGARYDPRFRINKEDLEILENQVKKLLELTKNICQEKILSFTKEPNTR